MDKLDRLGWAAGRAWVAYGVRFGVRTNEPSVLDELDAYLPPRARPTTSEKVDLLFSLRAGGGAGRVRRFHLLYAESARIGRSLSLEEILRSFESHAALEIAVLAPRHVFVHAGVVGWKGRAIVVPGRTFSGKSTLVAAFVRAGATYYSDEYAVIDGRGRVVPYPRALSLRDGPEGRARPVPPSELGSRIGRRALPIGLVLATHYREGARFRPRVLSPAESVLHLLGQTVSVRYRPRRAVATLARAVEGARSLKGVRGEADPVVERVLAELEERAA